MTASKVQKGAAVAKRSWTAFELLLLAPFIILIWYVSTEPIVVPSKSEPRSQSRNADESVAPSQASALAALPGNSTEVQQGAAPAHMDAGAAVFVTTGNTTLLERITPVARVVMEAEPVETAAVDSAPVAAAPVDAVPPPDASTRAGVSPNAMRVEISDGTGVEDFAKNVAQKLEQEGVTIAVSTPLVGTQKRNVILYRDGFEEEALRLSKLFVRPPAIVNNTNTRKPSDTADIRIVLGSAATREKILFASKNGAPKL